MLTLTYEKAPITKNGLQTLKKSDLQNFFKRIRADFEPRGRGSKSAKQVLAEMGNPHKFKYYAAAEYGSNYSRPHYHVIICGGLPKLHETPEKWWSLGHVHKAPCNIKTIRYALKYLQKSTDVGRANEDDRESEFQLMSKGIGASFMTPEMVAYYKATLNNYITLEGGGKASLPRYYKDKMLDNTERILMNARTLNYLDTKEKLTLKQENTWKREIVRLHQKQK